MPNDRSSVKTEQLVEALFARNRDLLAAMADIEELKEELIRRGAGKHYGHEPEHCLTVVGTGMPGIKLTELKGDQFEAAKEIAGAAFVSLFEREQVAKPKDGFIALAKELLNAPVRKKLLALVQKPTPGRAAYILGLPSLPKKPRE